MTEDITNDIFHSCALWACWEAMAEGKQDDSEYVRKLAYSYYEQELAEKNKSK